MVTNDCKFSSNIIEVIRAVLFLFFFHDKISQAQSRLQGTKIKKIRIKNI